MWKSGARIGAEVIIVILRPIPRGRPQALTAWVAAAVGNSSRGPAALLVAAWARPTTPTSALGSASFSPSNDFVRRDKPLLYVVLTGLGVGGDLLS